MREIKTGEVIGSVECPGCGATTPLKINAQKNVYFFCAKRLGEKPATGKQEICLTRMNYGRAGSKKIIEQFLAVEEETNHVQHDIGQQPEQSTEADATGAVLEQERDYPAGGSAAGFVAGLRKFLTE